MFAAKGVTKQHLLIQLICRRSNNQNLTRVLIKRVLPLSKNVDSFKSWVFTRLGSALTNFYSRFLAIALADLLFRGFQGFISNMKCGYNKIIHFTKALIFVYTMMKSRYYLAEILQEKTLPGPGFEPANFRPASSSLKPSPSLQVFWPPPAYQTRSGIFTHIYTPAFWQILTIVLRNFFVALC